MQLTVRAVRFALPLYLLFLEIGGNERARGTPPARSAVASGNHATGYLL